MLVTKAALSRLSGAAATARWRGGPAAASAVAHFRTRCLPTVAALAPAQRHWAATSVDARSRATASAPSGVRIRRKQQQPSEPLPTVVRTALDVAIHGGPLAVGSDRPLDVRLAAVRSLGELLVPAETAREESSATSIAKPLAAAAEKALHEVLSEVVDDSAPVLREAAAEALWNSWHKCSNKEAEAAMRRGLVLMEKPEQMQEAVKAFTEVTELDPGFVEGWNKRATALFMLKDYEKSIEDCHRALAIKPLHFGALAGLGMCYQGRGDQKEAVRWFKEALKVHPGLDGPRRVANLLEIQSVVNENLRPCVVKAVQALNDGTSMSISSSSNGVTCEWDLYHVRKHDDTDGSAHRYFMRVRITADSTKGPPANSDASGVASWLVQPPSWTFKSLARFYVLRFGGGRIFPLTRLTDGKAGFEIAPGEQHKFAWQLVLADELLDAAGGVLLERREGSSAEGRASSTLEEPASQSFVECGLSRVTPVQATPDEVERLRLGYDYTGVLDLRRMPLSPAGPDSVSGSGGGVSQDSVKPSMPHDDESKRHGKS